MTNELQQQYPRRSITEDGLERADYGTELSILMSMSTNGKR
jgi:hypothetical protein